LLYVELLRAHSPAGVKSFGPRLLVVE
jgi:hypothetical protein